MTLPLPNATPAEMRELAKLNERLYGTKPEVGVAKPVPKRTAQAQAFTDKVDARRQASQQRREAAQQQRADVRQQRADVRQQKTPQNDVRMAPPLPLPITPPPNSNFQGDTRVPNVNTIGAPMPPANNTGTPATNTTSGNPDFGGSMTMKKGGAVRAEKMASGGMTSKAPTASKRGDGIAQRGKTRGRMV